MHSHNMIIDYLQSEILQYRNLSQEARDTVMDIEMISQDILRNKETTKMNRQKLNTIQANLKVLF